MQIGHLDGITEGELHGWAFDSDLPNGAIKISVHLDGRQVAETLAAHYRPDVRAHFSSSGRHGFYIDLPAVCPIDRLADLDVRLPNGESIQGSPIRAHLPARRHKPCPTLLYLHIPKTAGTSLREAMLRNYKQSEIIYLYPDEPGFPIRSLDEVPMEQRARSRLVVGHSVCFGTHEEIPNDCLYFTLVRDPVSRVWSNYIHHVRSQDHPSMSGQAKQSSLEQLLGSRADMDNIMVRYFAGMLHNPVGSVGSEIYSLALRNLRARFPYIGHQENVDHAYCWLKTKFGWSSPSFVPSLNITEFVSDAQCGEGEKKMIQHFNQWDCKLYKEIIGRSFG